MKDKPVVIIITLLGGAIAAISCLINEAPLVMTLLLVLISLVAFLIIGIVVNKIYARIKEELDSKMAREKMKTESEEFERERRENEMAIARANGELPPEGEPVPEPEQQPEPEETPNNFSGDD